LPKCKQLPKSRKINMILYNNTVKSLLFAYYLLFFTLVWFAISSGN